MAIKHNFGERETDRNRKGEIVDCIQMPKFKLQRQKAIQLIEEGKFGLTDNDFWILKNEDKRGKIYYHGLIISHVGCLKINDQLPSDLKFNPKNYRCDHIQNGIFDGLLATYIDDTLVEYAEVSATNCNNLKYPFAMLLKRLFDRVVLKKSKIAFDGIYSEVEADEFAAANDTEETSEVVSENTEEPKTILATKEQLDIINNSLESWKLINMLNRFEKTSVSELTVQEASEICAYIQKEKANGTSESSK